MASGIMIANSVIRWTTSKITSRVRYRCDAVLHERAQHQPPDDVIVEALRLADVNGTGAAYGGVDDGRLLDRQVAVHVRVSRGKAVVERVVKCENTAGSKRPADNPSEVAGAKTY